jgi:SAM-dependent methyltransferase
MASYFGTHVDDAIKLADACRRSRLLRRGPRGRLLPTRRGRRYLETAVEEYYLERGLVEGAGSPAFRNLCRARQGLDMVQHGSLTRGQLEAIIRRTRALGPGRILDLGCGTGELGERVAAHAGGARLLAVDRAHSAISYAAARGTPNTAFVGADLETYVSAAPRGSADVVLSIDSLYWVDDLESFLEHVLEVLSPGGCFLCILSEFEDRRGGGRTLAAEDMEIGAALAALAEVRGDLRVETEDFTGEERALWLGSLALWEEWKDSFAAEGHAYLLRNIVREAEYLETSMRRGRGARYLFSVYRGVEAPMSER